MLIVILFCCSCVSGQARQLSVGERMRKIANQRRQWEAAGKSHEKDTQLCKVGNVHVHGWRIERFWLKITVRALTSVTSSRPCATTHPPLVPAPRFSERSTLTEKLVSLRCLTRSTAGRTTWLGPSSGWASLFKLKMRLEQILAAIKWVQYAAHCAGR